MKDTLNPIIGLEIHVELKTVSKMFCQCRADWFGQEPNVFVCPVCLGLPGAMPVPNRPAIDFAILTALALNCRIRRFSKFDRKNYFYPDLPKGYQISQYDLPFGEDGFLMVNGRRIGITRVHLEEDTGKLLHQKGSSGVDFNRSGVPLVEIVTEPDLKNAAEAVLIMREIHRLVRFLGVADADMEKGSMRFEPNISVSKTQKLPDYKVEVKNINSFRFAEKAINYEIDRQTALILKDEVVTQETRGWNEQLKQTVSQRSKEEAHDYRYFPEPDIPPIVLSERQISSLKLKLKILETQAKLRTASRKFHAGATGGLLALTALAILLRKKLKKLQPQLGGNDMDKIIKNVLLENAQLVKDYQSGKEAVINVLIGKAMQKTGGKVDAGAVREKLKQLIQQER